MQVLKNQGAFTWFVPDDESFLNLPSDTLKFFQNSGDDNDNRALPYLLYHVVNRRVMTLEFGADTLQETLHFDRRLRLNRYANGVGIY